jgi:general secretion pathway protein G
LKYFLEIKNMKRKKRALTLLEIIIVIFLITLITGAIGYNMKGALDRGRSFRTQQAKEQLSHLLLICLEEGEDPMEVARNPAGYLKKYDLAKNPQKLVQDGWGESFQISVDRTRRNFRITSKSLNAYNEKLSRTVTNTSEPEADETL